MIHFDEFFDKIQDPLINRNKDLMEKVYNFGKEQHKAQKRKITGEPYFIHPIRVAILLKEFDDDVIISGLLHDVVEDCEASLQDIEDLFGKRVAQLVDGVTKDPVKNDIFEKLEKIVVVDKYVIHIKLADRLDNMSDEFVNMKEKTQIKYLIETPKILDFAKKHDVAFLLDILEKTSK